MYIHVQLCTDYVCMSWFLVIIAIQNKWLQLSQNKWNTREFVHVCENVLYAGWCLARVTVYLMAADIFRLSTCGVRRVFTIIVSIDEPPPPPPIITADSNTVYISQFARFKFLFGLNLLFFWKGKKFREDIASTYNSPTRVQVRRPEMKPKQAYNTKSLTRKKTKRCVHTMERSWMM